MATAAACTACGTTGHRHYSIGYPRMSASGESSTTIHRLLHASGSHPIPPPDDPKTNQYNQDLGLIHSTNGNHLESLNEGSSIDHQSLFKKLMSNVEQEADNSKRNSEEGDVVLKNQQMRNDDVLDVRKDQQMATVEVIQQKRKDKDSADDIWTKMTSAYLLEETASSNLDVIISIEEASGSNRDIIMSIIEAGGSNRDVIMSIIEADEE
ncbi:Cisplatin resistance-associated overexpressed protein [Dorcoceras hygrometricum]|uniref:Cisplatin resistance-associated overexpressed protein n=1 Tax=Dorcoceras hygrometricum TaxID=472368 RepID=A0A2Z7BCG5_9LAMI|nr:Cisplatin resistance-associated overexpressed protein [Dorcoceras hygrometricum]